MSVERLLASQNPDGGFPYRPPKAGSRGTSWTEPTVYAVLALLAEGQRDAAQRGLRWILGAQNSDGGWPPQPGIAGSTWVTALVSLAPPAELGQTAHARAIDWLLATTGMESDLVYRARQWMMGIYPAPGSQYPGWPWVPGTVSWVGPTSLAILALDREKKRRDTSKIRARIESGRSFLLAHMCSEGGWNHGSARASGYELRPYPETTGMALAALRGVQSPQVDRALAVAEKFWKDCRSADALNWLRIGLRAHSLSPGSTVPELPFRTLPDLSLSILVSAQERGTDFFLG